MTDYQFQSPSRVCCVTGRTLKPGEKIYSVLLDEGDKFVRKDYAAEAWGSPPESAFSYWTGRVPLVEGKTAPIDSELLADWFRKLSDSEEPDKVRFRYVVALLLVRRKKLKFDDVEHGEAGDVLLLRDSRTGERFRVADPGLNDEAIAEVQKEVGKALGW